MLGRSYAKSLREAPDRVLLTSLPDAVVQVARRESDADQGNLAGVVSLNMLRSPGMWQQ